MKFEPSERVKPGDVAMILKVARGLEPWLFKFTTVGERLKCFDDAGDLAPVFRLPEVLPTAMCSHLYLLKVSPDDRIKKEAEFLNSLDDLIRIGAEVPAFVDAWRRGHKDTSGA